VRVEECPLGLDAFSRNLPNTFDHHRAVVYWLAMDKTSEGSGENES
jgi:hypothetical protein